MILEQIDSHQAFILLKYCCCILQLQNVLISLPAYPHSGGKGYCY